MNPTRSNLILLTAAALLALMVGVAVRADQIALRSEARVGGATITLSDVARLQGTDAEALAEVPIASMNGDRRTLGMAEVRQALDDHGGVHWGRVNLRGAMRITVHRDERADRKSVASAGERAGAVHAAPALLHPLNDPVLNPAGRLAGSDLPTGLAAAGSRDAPMRANPLPDAATRAPVMDTARTVRDLVRNHIEQTHSRTDGDGLRVSYRRESDPAWRVSASDQRLEVKPATPDMLGRVPFVVRVLRDGREVDEHRLAVDVALRVEGLVATRRLRRDQTLTDRDVRLTTRWIERPAGGILTDADRPVGQTVTRLIPEGELITEADLAGAIVVRRGSLIKARYLAGRLMLTVYCRAAEDGRLGDVIELRNTRNREIYQGRITGANEAVLTAGDAASGIARGAES